MTVKDWLENQFEKLPERFPRDPRADQFLEALKKHREDFLENLQRIAEELPEG